MKQIYLTVMVGLFLMPTILISQNLSISGQITRHNGEPLSGIDISCLNSTNSDADGLYEISDIPLNTSCELMIDGMYDKYDDVSVLDVLIVRQQVLAITSLNTFQLIAADVNSTTTVTALDIFKIGNLALRKDDGVAPNWRFLSSANPLMTSFEIVVNDNLNNVDFTAIKRGDPAIASDHMPAPPNAPTPIFTIAEQEFETGDPVKIEVTVDNLTDIGGMQSTFSWDPTLLEFESISGFQDLAIQTNTDSINQGKLSILTAELGNINSGVILFTLNFTAIADAPIADNYVKMTDEMIPRQVVWGNPGTTDLFIVEGEYIGSEVQAVAVNSLPEELASFDVFPNPVSEMLNVNVLLKEKTAFDISIVNVLGQVIFTKQFEVEELNEMVDVSGLVGGSYFLSLRTERGVVTEVFVKE